MNPELRLVLAAVALVLAVVDLIRSQGRALTSWAVLCLAFIHVVTDWDALG